MWQTTLDFRFPFSDSRSELLRMKFLTHLPWTPWAWCFHVMDAAHGPSSTTTIRNNVGRSRTVRLIGADGKVKVYDRPIHASELLAEHPKHLVCHSDSFCIGQKVPYLEGDDELKMGHNYFLLPTNFFQSVLSFVTIASFPSNPAGRATLLRNLDIRRTPSGAVQIRVLDEFIDKLLLGSKDEEDTDGNVIRLCTTKLLEKEYKLLVRSQQWKPKLDTIREGSTERRPKMIKMMSFGRKKVKDTIQQQSAT